VIKGKRQTKAIDWWSLGVLIYEMLCGEPPFWDDDGKKLLKAILEDSVTFKSNVSLDAQDLIKSLLETSPDKRLGSNGVSEIKQHPFFKGINWMDIYTKQVRPPFVPLIRSESDT
jgi:serine/threonine protein kinase